MMGPRQEAQAALFYEFSLEDHVPQDHLLRSIDRFVDLSSIRAHLVDFYSQDPPVRHLDEAQEEGRDALRAPQTHPGLGSPPITWSMRRKRRIPPRRHRPEPP